MASYNSPYGSTPGAEYYASGTYERPAYGSPSPTPSPHRPYNTSYYYGAQTPARPQTRAHFRNPSAGFPQSPRYTSDGKYATFDPPNVSLPRSTRKNSFSSPRVKRERRNSHSYYRPSDSHGESDEDEYIEVNGRTYVLPARSRSTRYRDYYYYTVNAGGYGTDHHYYAQAGRPSYEQQAGYASPRYEPDRRPGHTRRNSTSVPQRPQTARPSSSHKKPAPPAPKATEADAKKHKIPSGYSLKNWDPTEEPILLLGSVFDANSLGKWIYDWTVYHHGPSAPISDMAGELWLLLIQLAGKVKRAEDCVPQIRVKDNRDMVEDFIESGDRLTDKLRKLLKLCEAPMLRASKRKETAQLGKNAGVEFVETLFGRERELPKTEQFMQSVRLWNLRFDANCEEILRKPSK